MKNRVKDAGADELASVRKQSRPYYWFVGIFSFFVNLLMLTGPLYMLQVYDRVLGSRSEATLLALTALVVFLYGMMGILDYARGRVMARVAARFQAALDMRVFDAVIRRSAVKQDELAATGLKDLEAVQRFIGSPVLMALFDLPFTPLFIAGEGTKNLGSPPPGATVLSDDLVEAAETVDGLREEAVGTPDAPTLPVAGQDTGSAVG